MIDLALLCVLEELKQLKYRYLRALDDKDWDAFAATLTEDVEADYGEQLHFRGRDEVVGYMRRSLPEGIVTVHRVCHPDLVPEGDEATGRWSLEDTVLAPEHAFGLHGVAEYVDRYRREDGVWRIAATGYRRRYEATLKLDELPGLSVR